MLIFYDIERIIVSGDIFKLVSVFMILFIIEWWFNGCNLKIIRFFVARKYVYWECL